MKRFLSAIAVLLVAALPAGAQFFTHGTDPGYLKWYSLESPHYKIIYPGGADSLARSYARLLEQFRVPVGRSIGFTPGEGMWGKMPVVLHTHNLYSNGNVAYAPAHMDLFTIPEPYGSDPVPWCIQLASHEPRHQAQLEKFEQRGLYKGLSYIIGQGAAPIAWELYLAAPKGEGDAVAAETGLAYGTRARTADFLEYMRVAFDHGDWRDLTRWTKGSFKHYTPDHYKAGYMLMAGTRYLYGNSCFTKDALEKSIRNPILIEPYNFSRQIKDISGKNTNKAFREAQEAFNDVWQADAAARAPFIPQTQVTPPTSFPVNYTSLVMADSVMYAIRNGYLTSTELVHIENGRAKHVQPFSSHASDLYYDSVLGRLYWSESVIHPRWELDGWSIVRYKDLKTGKTVSLTSGTMYYHPQPSPDGMLLSVSEYRHDGHSAAVVISALSGEVVRSVDAPEGLQLTESAWVGEDIYFAGLSAEGYGIYLCRADGGWKTVLEPSHQKISSFNSNEDGLEWVSDKTGVNELYNYSLESGKLYQLGSHRYGADSFCNDGETIYCTVQTLDGHKVFSAPATEYTPKEVVFDETHEYTIEDAITRQEKALGPAPDLEQEVELTSPKRYNRLLHPMRLHTWMPFYINVDEVQSISMESLFQTVSPGITGFFQNDLGTFYGQAGYSAFPDPDRENERWRHAFNTKFTYTGLYPVIEADIDVGGRSPRSYFQAKMTQEGGGEYLTHISALKSGVKFASSIKTYVPLSYSIGGRIIGLIPQVSYVFSNNSYNLGSIMTQEENPETHEMEWVRTDGPDARSVFMHRMTTSVRGYYMLPRAKSQIYPKLGVGLELGYSFRPALMNSFRANAYAYAYGYLPGISEQQGMRLSAIFQRQYGQGEFGDQAVTTLPRGFDSSILSFLSANYRNQLRLTTDYAIPVFVGDLSIPFIGYIRNFVVAPHYDFSYFGDKDNLWSAGADVYADMGKVAFLTMDANIGVSFEYLGGNVFADTGQDRHWAVSLIFNVDF